MFIIIEIHNLKKSYGKDFSLDIPKLHIESGSIVGLVGNNGAGKTTLLKLITDLLLPDSGEISIEGQDVRFTEDWKFITSSYLDETYLMDYLTAGQYIHFIASLKNIEPPEMLSKIKDLAQFVSPGIFNNPKLIRDYSKGNIQKIGIASCLMGGSKIVILDEPFSNLDPSAKLSLVEILAQYRNNGTTILLSSHDIEAVQEICDRVILLESGLIRLDIKKSDTSKAQIYNHFRVTNQYD